MRVRGDVQDRFQDGHIVLADPTHSGLIDIDKRLENAFINAFRLF